MSWWLEPVAEEAAHLVEAEEGGGGRERATFQRLSARDLLVLPRAQALKASC